MIVTAGAVAGQIVDDAILRAVRVGGYVTSNTADERDADALKVPHPKPTPLQELSSIPAEALPGLYNDIVSILDADLRSLYGVPPGALEGELKNRSVWRFDVDA